MEKNFVKQTPSFWKISADEFKHVNSICIAAMMMALNTLLGYFKIIIIPKILTISFASLAVGACAMYCGPLLTATVSAVADILKYIVRPDGTFFLGFTLNEFLTGLIYGAFFYQQKAITLKRCIIARASIVLLINMILTPLWLHILYKEAFMAMVSARLLKNVVMFPIDVFLLYMVTQTTAKIRKRQTRQNH